MVYIAVIVAYFVIMLLIGILTRNRAQDAEGFFVAGRRGSFFRITGSLVATIIGGSAAVGMAGLGFSRGFTGAWWILVGSAGLVVLGLFLAKKVRDTGVFTLPALMARQYGGKVAVTAAVLIVIAWIAVIAGQILATWKIISVLGIGNPSMWMALFTAVIVTYLVIGGQHADIDTDVAQAVIIFAGIFLGLILVLPHVGGLHGLKNSLPVDSFSFPVSDKFGPIDLLSYFLLVGLTYVVGPDMFSKILSARDAKTARKSIFWTAAILIPITFAIVLIGMAAAALFPQLTSSELAFPYVIKDVLPTFAGALVLAALVSATMSSADGCLLSASTILTVDVIKRFRPALSESQSIRIARWGIVIIGILALLLALAIKGVISALMLAYTVYTAGVILPVLAGFYREKLKITAAGAMAAIVGGGGTALISKLPGVVGKNIPVVSPLVKTIHHLDLWALVVSVVLLFLVSFVDNRFNHRIAVRSEG